MSATQGSFDAPYLCFLLLGMGTLFPWNSLITAADFWEARYPGKHTDRLLTIAYLPVNLLVISAMVHWHSRVRPHLRVVAGLLGFTLAIAAVPLLDLAPATPGSLAALLLVVAACGVCDGLAQGALFGEAAQLPARYTQALVAGTAVSGVVVSLLRVLTKATLPDTEAGLRRSANLYFAIAAMVCAACTFVYTYVLPRLPAVQQYKHAALEAALHEEERYQQQYQQQQEPARSSIDVELSYEDHMHWEESGTEQPGVQQRKLADGSPGRSLLGPGSGGAQPGGSADGSASAEGWLHDSWQQGQHGYARGAASAGGAAGGGDGSGHSGGAALTAGTVFRMLWRLAVANTLIYTITLSIFPGVLAEDVHSVELGSWYPVALLTAFNFADWAGKSLPGVPALRLRDERTILGAALLRVLFVPAFHFAAVGGAGPAVISLLTLLLGVSNGYLTGCAMMEGPALVPPAGAELAGNQMVLFLILGLCIGAFCGFLWLL